MIAERRILAATWALGGGDLLTGLGLIVAPARILAALGVDPAPYPTVLLGWLGAFVVGVGAGTIYPLVVGLSWRARLPVALEVTALVRYAVATFLALSMLRGALPGAWWGVAVYDAVAATFQLLWLRPEILRAA